MNDYPIGETIRTLRTSRELSQKELGDALDISTQAVSKWETGAAMPDTLMLPQIAAFFGVSIDSLFFGSTAPNEPDPILGAPVADFADDGVLRVVQFLGNRPIASQCPRKEQPIALEFEAAQKSLAADHPPQVEVFGSCVIHGTVRGDLRSEQDVTCSNVLGSVTAGGSITCENVDGNAEAGGNITCDDIDGDASAGGSITCDDIDGNVVAADITCDSIDGDVTSSGRINCDTIEGDVTSTGSVSCDVIEGDLVSHGSLRCDSVGGNVSAEGDVVCDSVGGSACAKGNINCDEIGGNAEAGGDITCETIEGDATAGRIFRS